VLKNKLRGRPASAGFPSLFQIIYRTALLSSIRTGKEGRGAVAMYLEPPTELFETFQMDALDRIIEAGYRYASEELRKREIDPFPPA
jgi:hypothetical protein